MIPCTPSSRDGQCVVSILQTSGGTERVLDLTLWKRLNCRPWFIFAVPFIILSLFLCHLYLCFCFSHLSSPNVFNLYWYGRICVTFIIFIAHLWIFYNSATSLWKWCDPNWMGHLTLCVLSSPLKYILNLMFLLSLMARKRFIQLGRDSICFEWADLFFLAKTLGMSLTIKWKAVPVACKHCTKRGSTSSFWIMHYLLCIKLLIEWRVWDCLRRKSGIWLEGKRLLLTETFWMCLLWPTFLRNLWFIWNWFQLFWGGGKDCS